MLRRGLSTLAAAPTAVRAFEARLLARKRGGGPIVVCASPDEMAAARTAMDIISVRDHGGAAAAVGFVPTMGALHSGHLMLLGRARAEAAADAAGSGAAQFLVSSVFVNPTQFAPSEDLNRYPRPIEADVAALDAEGADVVYAPTARSMYAPVPVGSARAAAARTFVNLTGIDETPEGAARPGFFRGVATVVTKLLAAVRPQVAVFGQKDGIQCVAVRTLARDLGLGTRIAIAPTARAPDGLALSSRNAFLSPQQRAAAPALYAALRLVADALQPLQPQQQQQQQGRGTGGAGDASALRLYLDEVLAARRRAAAAAAAATEDPAADNAAVERAAQAAAQAAAVATAAGVAAGPAALHPALAALAADAAALLAARSGGLLAPLQYLTFSDACTGQALGDLRHSSARNGAVLLSAAVGVRGGAGGLRLIDNVMCSGSEDDLGMPA